MKFYHVYDGDEGEDWFTNKAEAMRFAKELANADKKLTGNAHQVWVYLVDIGNPTAERIRCCLAGKNYAVSSTEVWTNAKSVV